MRSPASASTVYDSARARLQPVVEIQELWRYRYLIRNLVSRDLKVRYKRSDLGIIWVSLNPLLTMAVQALVFSNFFGTTLPHYPVYLLAGTLVFTLFSQSTVAAMGNLINNGSTLRRMYVPPSVFVASSIGSAVVNFVFALAPLLLVAVLFHAQLSITWLYILAVAVQTALFASGVAFFLAASMVFFNDTNEIYLVFISAYNFLTPIFYPLSLLPKWLQNLEQYNPMFLYVSGAQRAITLDVLPSMTTQVTGWIIAIVALAAGWLIFTTLEDRFAYHF